jgi:hypothetical protein
MQHAPSPTCLVLPFVPTCVPAALLVDWTSSSEQAWDERLRAAPGATTVEKLLRKHGVQVSVISCGRVSSPVLCRVLQVRHATRCALDRVAGAAGCRSGGRGWRDGQTGVPP